MRSIERAADTLTQAVQAVNQSDVQGIGSQHMLEKNTEKSQASNKQQTLSGDTLIETP
jgi:hypothetical protein